MAYILSQKKTPQNASFSSFIEEALLDSDKKQFYTKGSVVSVRSSIPDVIADSADKAKQAQDRDGGQEGQGSAHCPGGRPESAGESEKVSDGSVFYAQTLNVKSKNRTPEGAPHNEAVSFGGLFCVYRTVRSYLALANTFVRSVWEQIKSHKASGVAPLTSFRGIIKARFLMM